MIFIFIRIAIASSFGIVAAQINVSPLGTATQSSTLQPYSASRAITGGETNDWESGSCSHTGYIAGGVWWMLTLPNNTIFIEQVNIFFRSGYERRFDGYSLYLSYTSISGTIKQTPPGILCYKDPMDGVISMTERKACNQMAQYIIIYTDNVVDESVPFLNLCDVQVMGCSKHRFGQSCTQICSSKCFDQHCYPSGGRCVYGCNCLNNDCDGNEFCTMGCKKGFMGHYCNQGCATYSFGRNCIYTCHCNNQGGCDNMDGICLEGGCQPGWLGGNCSIECAPFFFGQDCSYTCHCKNPVGCNNVDGICMDDGCQAGWQGNSCSTGCATFSFGEDCRYTCHCSNAAGCDNIDGICLEGGCQPGWQGGNCSIECNQGHFGQGCTKTCDGCFSRLCNNVDGECVDKTRCNPGWETELPYCNTQCSAHTFGNNCSLKCQCRNKDINCNQISGICPIGGCQKGWKGDSCYTECPDGTFGFDCHGNCSQCVNNTCDRFSGVCTLGCVGCLDGNGVTGAQIDDNTSSAGTIAGVIVAVIIITAIAIVSIMFIFRRQKKKQRGSTQLMLAKSHDIFARDTFDDSKKQNDHEYANVQLDSSIGVIQDVGDNEDISPEPIKSKKEQLDNSYQNTDDTVYNNVKADNKFAAHNVAIDGLAAYIAEKLTQNEFESDFESLPKGHVYPHSEGTKETNKVKNRFLSTWPYDHSRVILNGKGSSDYINASYIDNYSKEKAYIATQGPKKNTIKDFWEMIWQEHVEVIVMVTQLVEGGRKKCEKYWPDFDHRNLTAGHLKISFIKEKRRTVFVERTFTLSSKKENTDRTLHHFHFTEWPDHGVPDIIKLVTFYRHVKAQASLSEKPIVVHCSAGIGRTGTFLAIDALYEHGQRTGCINVMEYAQMMRKDRMNMIQTKDQYQTVFEALLELFSVPDTACSRDGFTNKLQDKQNQPVAKNQTKLYLEFQKLQVLKPTYLSSDFSKANSVENQVKNSNDILAHDKYRAILMSTENDRTDYVNAVIIPEYEAQTKIIVTQYPLDDTLVDFWTLIYDHDCSVVVMLDNTSDNSFVWPGAESSLDFQMFTVQTIKEDHSTVNIKLTKKTNKDERSVSIINMYDWNSDNLPVSTKVVTDFLKKVSQTREGNPASLAVVDRDGASRSGLFVALTLVLEKLKLDDVVDIFQVVRLMQIRRPDFMTNYIQYEFCHQCVKEYLNDDSLYANT